MGSFPHPRGGTDREIQPVFGFGDAPDDFGLSKGVLGRSDIARVAKREPYIVENSHYH